MNRAKKLTLGVHTDFSEIHDKINKQPNNIEELTDIQNFIANVPGEMEKWRVEIDKIIDIYDIIDEFEYKLDREVIRSKQEM